MLKILNEMQITSEHTRFLSVVCIIGVFISKFVFDSTTVAAIFATLYAIVIFRYIYIDYKLNFENAEDLKREFKNKDDIDSFKDIRE